MRGTDSEVRLDKDEAMSVSFNQRKLDLDDRNQTDVPPSSRSIDPKAIGSRKWRVVSGEGVTPIGTTDGKPEEEICATAGSPAQSEPGPSDRIHSQSKYPCARVGLPKTAGSLPTLHQASQSIFFEEIESSAPAQKTSEPTINLTLGLGEGTNAEAQLPPFVRRPSLRPRQKPQVPNIGMPSAATSSFDCGLSLEQDSDLFAPVETPVSTPAEETLANGPSAEEAEKSEAARIGNDSLETSRDEIVEAEAVSEPAEFESEENGPLEPISEDEPFIDPEQSDLEVAQIIDAWPRLPETIRGAILALIEAAA